ncbi:uncharacterized protein DUF4247 [Actinomadura hallensis]|uniref:Uncharacterized protein DUF4247 n=1 Tax=Actinomadura hallensis TaxID=337895 RepID=A0A543IAV8_9ACTN|nr:DUF4247 domain-containing protein [Actinomadura hallensis]TQM67708.1 uncharacterized protein DUF4247 [Actinomadura hallensis]
MNSRHRLIGGALAAVLMVPALGACGNAQRNWISDRYSKVGSDTYRSPKAPPVVATEIGRKFRPIDRVDSMATRGPAGGIFLRYPKLVVGVLPDGTGSRITVDSPRRGYSRYYSHVGGVWMRPGSNGWTSSGAASFRGGGPGSGK